MTTAEGGTEMGTMTTQAHPEYLRGCADAAAAVAALTDRIAPATRPGYRLDTIRRVLGQARHAAADPAGALAEHTPVTAERRIPLSRPAGRDPAVFYQSVADAHNDHSRYTHRVAVEMAAEAGVPVTTVHRWIKEARARGYLLPSPGQGRTRPRQEAP